MEELGIVLFNLFIIGIAYSYIHPRVIKTKREGTPFFNILLNDFFTFVFTLAMVSSVFITAENKLTTELLPLNWFWFTVVTYFLIDLPAMVWYVKKHKIEITLSRKQKSEI